jgi:hypothetical protein
VSFCSLCRLFHLDTYKLQNASQKRCNFNHSPETISCFKVPLRATSDEHSTVCSVYIRPLTKSVAVQTGLNVSLATLNLTVTDFQVVAANTYMSAKHLGEFLRAAKFSGRVVAFPKFGFGRQRGIRLNASELPVPDADNSTLPHDTQLGAFCETVTKAWHRKAASCLSLDFSRLSKQRNADAKASIYPMTYNTSDGVKVCHKDKTEALSQLMS